MNINIKRKDKKIIKENENNWCALHYITDVISIYVEQYAIYVLMGTQPRITIYITVSYAVWYPKYGRQAPLRIGYVWSYTELKGAGVDCYSDALS